MVLKAGKSVAYLPKDMRYKQHGGQQYCHPHSPVFQQFEIRKQDKSDHKYSHIFAVGHSSDRHAKSGSKYPCRFVKVEFIEVEKECGEKKQRCVRGGHETIDGKHHERGGDSKKRPNILVSQCSVWQHLPNKPNGSAMEQYCGEADRKISFEKSTTESGEQRHHRRVVVVAPVEKLSVKRIVGLI